MQNKNKAILVFVIFSLFFLFIPIFHSSASLVPCGTKELGTPCTLCHLIIGIKYIVDWLIKIAVTAALVGITISGVMYVISTGDPGMMQTAKNFMKACIIGFILTLAAWLIVYLTMWIIAAKTDLGISQKWTDFTCSTTAKTDSAGSGSGSGDESGGGSNSNENKCCVTHQNGSEKCVFTAADNCSNGVVFNLSCSVAQETYKENKEQFEKEYCGGGAEF